LDQAERLLNVRIKKIYVILIGAARALLDIEGYDAEKIALKAMQIAAEKCIYTNSNFVTEKITW
jgi:ATP-dependent protease HslVU (ClpYQ) peptidase subunit